MPACRLPARLIVLAFVAVVGGIQGMAFDFSEAGGPLLWLLFAVLTVSGVFALTLIIVSMAAISRAISRTTQ